MATSRQREKRIEQEIVVDTHSSEERVMGWYYYLESKLKPFTGRCVANRVVSPLEVGEEVQVTSMAPEDECRCDMFVMIRWSGRKLAVPLAQLKPARGSDPDTKQAVEDWLYWVEKGYEF